MYPEIPAYVNHNMGFFEGFVIDHKAAIHIAGDRHYYRRHEEVSNNGTEIPADSPNKMQKITAGGGGAFLHPTHNEKGVDMIGKDHRYKLRTSFPDEKTSAKLGWWNWLFLFRNWRFGILTAILYVLTSWAFIAPIGEYGLGRFWTALGVVLHRPVEQPIAFIWMAAIFGGFVLFTDTNSKWYRWIAGPIHGLFHLAGVFFVSWWVSHCIDSSPGAAPAHWSWLQLVLGGAAIAFGGFLVGPTIMGIYLFVSLNIFKRHHNEAFSSIKCEDYKNFIRFKVERNGDLVIYPVGVKKVIKKWKPGPRGGRGIVPDGEIKEENKPFLIEEPIRFVKPVVAAAAPPPPPPPPAAPGDDG